LQQHPAEFGYFTHHQLDFPTISDLGFVCFFGYYWGGGIRWISDGGVLLLLILNSTLLEWHPARIRRMFLHDSKASSTRESAAGAAAAEVTTILACFSSNNPCGPLA
jgi:hypothetical protein